MTHLFNQLEQALQIQETKTHDTQLAWVGDDIDFLKIVTGTDEEPDLQKVILYDTYVIMVGDHYILFNKEELTEDLVDEIKRELGI